MLPHFYSITLLTNIVIIIIIIIIIFLNPRKNDGKKKI